MVPATDAQETSSDEGSTSKHRHQEDSMSKSIAVSIAAGLVIGALAWIDPVFIPLVLAGPLVSGAVCAAKSVGLRLLALAWAIAGTSMLVSDWIVNREDVAFHAVLTVVMVALAAASWKLSRTLTARRGASELQ